MKKFFVLFTSILLFAVASCGPSDKQIEEKRIADSITMVAYTDSCNQVLLIADSLQAAKLDSIAKAAKQVKK